MQNKLNELTSKSAKSWILDWVAKEQQNSLITTIKKSQNQQKKRGPNLSKHIGSDKPTQHYQFFHIFQITHTIGQNSQNSGSNIKHRQTKEDLINHIEPNFQIRSIMRIQMEKHW